MRIATATEPSESPAAQRGGDSHQGMVGASVPEIQSAKAIIGDEVREMLRLTRTVLRPTSNLETESEKLAAVMKKLAPKIRESGKPEVMRSAIDEIILEELKARYENTRPSNQP